MDPSHRRRPSEAVNIEPYLSVRAATTPAWLVGGRLAFLSDATGVPQVWLTDAAGAESRPLTTFGDRVGALLAAPGGDRLVFGMDRGGDERQQVWLLDPGQGQTRPLTADPTVIHAFGAVAPDGRRFAFASNARDQRYFDVATITLDESPKSVRVLATDELLSALAFSPDGRSLLVRRQNTNLDHDLFLVPLDGGDRTLLTPHQGEASISHAAFDPAGEAVYAVTNQDRDLAALVGIDVRSRRQTLLAAPDWDVEALAVASQGGRLAYAVNEDGVSRLVLRETASGAERPVTGLPAGVVEGMTWSPDGERLAFSWSGARHPSDVWVCGTDGAAHRVTVSDAAGLDPAGFREPETIRYRSFDGRQIPAFWFRPTGPGPWPVVVDVHGGPESQRRVAFAPVTQFLLARGFAVLAPNVRGSTGYGKTYCHLDDVERRMDAVADLAAATDWLRGQPDATDRVAVMGQSYGGFMTLAALTTYPERWAAGVDVVGIANWLTFFEQTGPWRRSTRAAEYGDPQHDAALLRELSPIHKAERIVAPLLVIHGRNDPRVPLGEAEQIAGALRAAGRDVELIVFDDEGHGLVKRQNRIVGYGAVARFLGRVLGADPDQAAGC